jgi:hypothetical protein
MDAKGEEGREDDVMANGDHQDTEMDGEAYPYYEGVQQHPFDFDSVQSERVL